MAATQSPEFEKATVDSKKLKAKPTNDQLLQLYSLFKIGTGEDISKAEKPGAFDLKGKAKLRAWEAEVKKGTSVEDAQSAYVKLVEELKGKLGFEG